MRIWNWKNNSLHTSLLHLRKQKNTGQIREYQHINVILHHYNQRSSLWKYLPWKVWCPHFCPINKTFWTSLIMWVKVFKNGPNKICGKQPSTNFTWSILEHVDLSHTGMREIFYWSKKSLYIFCKKFTINS